MTTPNITQPTPTLSERDAAAYLAFSEDWLRKMRRAGRVPFIRVNRSVRYRIRDLDKWQDQHAVKATRL
jgi:excisionase family DNA binding protein